MAQRLVWTRRGANPGGGEVFLDVQLGPVQWVRDYYQEVKQLERGVNNPSHSPDL